MKNTELKRKIVSFLIIALMLSSVFSGAVMVLASVNTTINDTSADDEVQIDTDTAPPTIIDHSPTSDNAYVNASIGVTFSEAMNETSVEGAFSIHPSVVGSFDWDGNVMNFIPDILSYSTAYDISINEEASDLAGNNLESSYSWEFTTKSQGQDQDMDADTKSPLISDVSTVNIITNSTTITWRTDKPSDSLVKYGTETGSYTLFANDPSFVTEHSIKITGLLPCTTYYYVVNSTDSSRNQNESVEYNFNTQSEAEEIVDVSPPTITFVLPTPPNNSIVNESEIIINITANEYLDIAILDWDGTNETMQGSGRNWYLNKILTNGTYIYRVHGKDTADNWAVSGTRTVTVVPSTPTAPLINDLFNNITNDNLTSITLNKSQSILISHVSTANITANSTTITWRTDEPSDSLVKYGTETGSYTLFANDPSFVTEHNIKITGLLSSTIYYYVVNSTDSSGNQNESAEYNFNTLSETEGIVDVSPPTLTFVPPTPPNNSIVNESEIIINITANEYLDLAILDWNGTNETMQGSEKEWYIDKSLTNGTYIYKVYGNDTADNWGVSGTRTVTVVPPTPTAPLIVDLFNNITNDNSTTITINKSQSIFFSATADQNIDTWHWYRDGIDQSNNCSSYTTSFNASGSYSVAVNATNENGISNTAIFNIAVTDITILISDVSTVNITANSTTIAWRTDKPSDSLVKYGTETGSYTLFANDPSFVTDHNIKITGLLPSTTYYYAVNSTDSSGTQNESAEYDFNTQSETEEIVDVSPPTITFVAPTPANNSIVNESEIIINIAANEYLDLAILDWNGTNETMQGSGRNWYINKILTNGTYIYRVHGNDTADNWAVSGTRTVTVVPPAPAAPFIVDLFNNITNDNSTSITINKSQSIFFGASADQDIDTWHWYKDGIDQSNNCSSYTTSFNASGSYSVAVNATNANGVSNTAIFNISVTNVTLSKIPTISGAPFSGDWIISGTESYSDQEIILNGNLSILGGASLTLNNVTLMINSTANGQRTITIQQWGSLYIDLSNITGNYYYYFNNYGYLKMQNSSVSTAYSIYFHDSSDDSSVINNCTIKNTASSGIYMDHVSPTINYNTISDSGSYGIYAYYSSPNIINNTISDSGSYGICANLYSSPNIINNTISGSSVYGIYVYQYSSPRIENNTIKNNNVGGITIQYYSSPTIINNVIDKNGLVGVYVISSSYPRIIGCTISDQTDGITIGDSQTVTVENSSISSTRYDYYLTHNYLSYSGYIKSTNTSFSKSKVFFTGTDGVLDVYWHDTVMVEYDHQPVNDSFVEVFDNANSLVTSGVTGANGQVKLTIKEYTQGPAAMLNCTPHILKATKSGFPNGSIESNVTWTKSDTIVLGEEVYIPEQPIVFFGDWIINESVSYSNRTIIVDNGNIIIETGGSLTLNSSLLQLRYTTNAGYKIEIQSGANVFLYDSNVTASYPELNFYYYFNNYGYLNMQNSSVSTAYSIHFYDSSDDSSVITNSTIMNTASHGIYMDHASPTINYNTISDSGSYGIYACYYSSPNIINNTISGSSNYGIYASDSSSPRIENNTIKNNNKGGIFMRDSSSTIINNLIDKNGQFGVYVCSFSYPRIIGCTISDQTYGIGSDSQAVITVENSSISSTSYDYYLHFGAYIKSTNTSFSKSKVFFSPGPGGVLDVYWHDTVTVEYDYQPVNDSFVEVFDNANSLVTSGVTDANGQVKLAIKEYTQGLAAMLNYTPHILKATKTGYPNGSIESNVTWTRTDTIVLGEEVYIPEQPVVIFGDWIINDTVHYSNKTIIVDNGNIIIGLGGSLTLNSSLLQLRYTTNAEYKIEIQNGGSLFLYGSNVSASYPELNFYYYFRNYGYLNMQKSSVSMAYSIHFYDSSDDSSVINNSTIKNNANSGISVYYASPTIIDNTISDSGSIGICAYLCSSPNIINNTISGSSNFGIDVYHTSSPRIENNTIKNNNIGGINIQYYSSPTIINNVIDKNGHYGVYVHISSSYPKIIGCTISDQTYGIRSNSQTVTVENSSISSTSYDYYLYNSAYIKSTNTSFSKSKVLFFNGTGGVLDVYWHIDVNVVDANANPVSKANVTVRDYFDTVIYNGTTDLEGWTREIVSEEYKQTAAGETYYTPHNVSAEYNDTANTTIVTIDESKEATVMLSINQPLTALILSPDNNSLFIQRDTIDFTGIGFDPIDGILANSSLTWTSSIDGEIGIGSSLSLTNLSVGYHTVTFTATNSLNESVNDTVEITVIGRADLIVEDVEWSHMSPNLDDIVTFNATVKNIGLGYVIQPFYVRFYINYTYLGQTIVSNLSANESIIVTQTWTAAPDAGNITVVADYYDDIQEINESNNTRTELLPPVRLPDIVVSAVTWIPTTFNESQMVNFSALIENTGAGNTTRYFEVKFYIDNTSIGSVGVNGIMAGNTTSVSRTWTATPGDHTIRVVADDLNQVPESNETNNDRIESLAMIEYADLTVSSITWTPATFCDGDAVNFTAIVENIGAGNITKYFDNSFYINGSSIGSKLVNGLSAGSSVYVTLTWTATPGIHGIKVKADSNNAVSESNETNNERSGALPGIEYSDFIVTDITWAPITFADGDTVTFNATIENNGTGNTSRNFYVGFKIDESYIGEVLVKGLSSGTFTRVTRTWSASVGDHNITVVADRYNSVPESNETNNTLTLPLGGVEYPDLIVSNVTCNPTTFCDGEPVTFNATIKNNGTGNTSRTFYNTFYIDESAIGGRWVNGLSAGSSVYVTLTWTATPGIHTVKVMADSNNAISESNETNNERSESLPDVEQADLIIEALTWTPSNFSDGQVVTFTVSVGNIGPGNTTRGFYTRFLIDDAQIGEKYISGILSDSSIDRVQVWPATPGGHTVKVIVDSHSQVTESNESNNEYLANLSEVEMADLIVANLTWMPLNFSEGQFVAFNASIKNIGGGDTTRQFYTGFLIDNDSIGNVVVSGLSSGETKYVSLGWLAESGYHIVSAVADPEGYIVESNTSNNSLSYSLPEVFGPDLVVTDIEWSQQNITDGNSVTFNVTIGNIGVGNTSRNCGVLLELDDTYFQQTLFTGLVAGETTTIVIPRTWIATFGVHAIKATVDNYDVIQEDNETNNGFYATISVNDTNLPVLSSITPTNGTIIRDVFNITVTLSDGVGSGVDLNSSNISVKRDMAIVTGITEVVGDSLVFVPDSPFNESEYTVFINAADNVGSCSLITTSFILDKTNPVINITGVSEGSLYETCVTPVIEITDLHLSSRSSILNGHQFINGTTITADGVYVLYAQADDEAGNQAEMTVNFSMDAKPSPPTGLMVYRGDTTADLSWDPNIEEDIAGYNVYRDGVRLNNDTITGISYHDTNLSASVTYQYTITAVDLAGHESDEAGVSSISITLTGYGTLVHGSHYLTCGFADEVNVIISNEGTTQVDVESATIELVDSVGDSTHAASEGSFTIEPSGSYFMNKQILTGNQTSKIRVVVNLSGGAQISRVFDVNVRDSPVQPVEVSVPTLMEGYRDAINVKLTNYGSASVSVNPQELVVYLNDGNGTVISQGRGEGAWLWINPNTTRSITAFINTPMAKGDIHLENLSIGITLPTYYGLQTGQFKGSTFNVIENVPSKYQTVSPIEIYHGSLVKGGTIQFDLVYLNQGTGDLTVDQGDAMISIKDLNGSIIASGISLRSKVTVMPDSTQKFTIDVFIPVNASDTVAVEAVISASYWTLDGNADYLRFNASKFASTIKPGYNANAVTDKTIYNRGENVTISGQAKYENGTAVPNASIRLKISSKGFSRDILIDSDLNGEYTYIFKPLDTEAGMYIVSATHPAVWDIENDAEFEILGLYIEPLPGIQLAPFTPPVNLEMSQNDQRVVTLEVINLGESNLTNVHLTIIDDNAGDEVDASTTVGNFDLLPKESESVDITVTAGINAADNATFVITATCEQGADTTTKLSVKLYPATPLPRVAPDYIQAGISPGGVEVETVTISNVGYQALCDVSIVNPSHPWISIVTDPDLGEIDPGANATFDILINPSENVSLGVYEDNVEIVSSNHPNITFPMRFFVTSEQTGDLKFTVKNQLEEVLPNAEVSLVDPDTYTLTFTGKTNTNGETIFSGIPTGRYSYKVVAPLHEQIIGSAIVEMGTTTEVKVTTMYSFLQVEWTVTPTTIEDVYEITHNITYDTRAPVPYIKMDVVVEEVYMVPGATYPGNITLTNLNDIVSVFNGTPGANIHSELVSVEFLVDTIPELKPHESVTIPFVVKLAEHHSPTAKACDMYVINIPVSWDSVCWFGVYKDDVWQYDVNGSVASDYLTLYIHPSCIDFIKDGTLCLADILSGGAVTGYEWLTVPLQVKGCIDTAANCILQNNYCNLWQGVDCGAGLYGCFGGPFSSCLDAANSLAKCMFQDECCGKEPTPSLPYHPPSMGGGGGYYGGGYYGGGYYGGGYGGGWGYSGGGYSGSGLPPYSPSPWTIGPCMTSPETMCIQVKLEIRQELTMERQAFDAMLKLTNLRDDYDMTDISVNIDVRDHEGNPANDLFFMNVTSMEGIDSIENGMLDPGGSGTIHWLIIPTPGAGGTEPEGVEYTAKAYINYSVKGLPFDFETWPDEITVEPMPKLTLDYMLPRKVYGDDPMTQGIIEPVVPFIWGVRINNRGYGPAKNLAIDSAQPRIVESTAGVNIDFKLLGTYVDGERIENTLKINFGDIPPGGCVAAGWEMMCSLTGEFTNYTATYKHSDALGGEATSLIEDVRTHVLVHEFINDKYGQDNAFDFLVDTNEDGVPDMIIDSACNDQPITRVSAEMVGTPSPEEPTVTVVLIKNAGAGWVYAELDDPLENNYNISKVVRCIDGKVLNSRNYWLRDGKIHIVDDPGENYSVTYEIGDTIPPASITNLQNITCQTWINWTWDNPADPDFDHTEVWINGEFQVDVTTPKHTYNATGLNSNTTYEIGTRTVDLSGNVNQTWMNDTAKTLLVHDITPPKITNVTAIDITTNSVTITWDTDELSDSLVKYGTESGAYTLQEHNASNVMSHSIKLTELVAETIYYFVVNSTDLAGNSNESTEYNLIAVTRLCGDVAPYPDCNGIVDMGDVILLLNNVSYPEDPRYILSNNWAGDCRCTGVRDMGDVILLLNNVSYPEDPRYVLDCC